MNPYLGYVFHGFSNPKIYYLIGFGDVYQPTSFSSLKKACSLGLAFLVVSFLVYKPHHQPILFRF